MVKKKDAPKKIDLYISFDIETDGPIPSPGSMLSLGAAAYDIDGDGSGQLISTFKVNLEQLPDGVEDPSTMKWWETQPEAWKAARANRVQPAEAMRKWQEWCVSLQSQGYRLIPVAYPAGFDWTFLYWYMMRYNGSSPFSFVCLDMKTLAFALTEGRHGYRGTSKRKMPKRWFGKGRHTHDALDDALEQGEMFCKMMGDLITVIE